MDALYWTIVFLALHTFVSTKIDTRSLLRKVWLLLVVIGSLIDISQLGKTNPVPNYFIELGIIVYFVMTILSTHFDKKLNRRATDRASIGDKASA
jgi:hypothetical protein